MSTSPTIEWETDGVTINGNTNLIGKNISIGSEGQNTTVTLSGTGGIVIPNGGISIGSGTTFRKTGFGQIGGNLDVIGNINIGSAESPQIQLNSIGTSNFAGKMIINNSLEAGDITASSITMGDTTFNNTGYGNIGDNLNVGGQININSGKIILNANGSSTFTGQMIINNSLETQSIETQSIVINNPTDGLAALASINTTGDGSFASVTTPSITLNGTPVNSITTTSSVSASPDTSIPTVSYLSKVVNSQSSTEPIKITFSNGEGENPTYSYRIVMWNQNDPPANSRYFGKEYSYTYDANQQKYVFSETAVTGTGTYPW